MSDWIRHAIWWQVYPLGFTGAERNALPEGAGAVPRLRRLEAWLPHLLELGCNGLALGPVFESGTHGYDTVDYAEVADHVVRVMTHWCDRGVDAWRLDAAYAVPPPFWRQVLPRVRESHPDVWVVGEMIHGDYAGYVDASGIDSVTQYELWKAIWSALNDRNLFELAHALRRHGELLGTFLPQTFVGNHDVTRLASRLADRRHLAAALALLFTLPGVPTVYYGDEFGCTGVKEDRPGGDDAVRPAFPSRPEDADPPDDAVRTLHQELIGLRRRHAWLVDALVLNLAEEQAQVAVPMQATHVLAGSGRVTARGDRITATVEPHAFLLIGDA